MSDARPVKPLGRKAYGSIPHLPGSRLGPGDHSIHAGQDAICMVKARDRHDRIIVTEKLDGSNVAVANVDGQIIALTRSGYTAAASPYEQHHLFASWVERNVERFGFLATGERVNGEWLALAHGTRYALIGEPLVVFDLMRGNKRAPWDELRERCWIEAARVLSDGPPMHVDAVLPLIETSGHGALDPVEGAVWRVERKGIFDFMAKWVRPDKIDGKYLAEITGHPEVWHWPPGRVAA